jgi:hypothetical protein
VSRSASYIVNEEKSMTTSLDYRIYDERQAHTASVKEEES